MNLVEQKSDDRIYIEPILVISRLAQLSVNPVGTVIHIVDGSPKITRIVNPEGDQYFKYKLNEIINTFEQLWEPIVDYVDWYKTSLAEKYKPEYTLLTIRAIQGIQKLRDLVGSRVAIEALLSRIVVILADSCGIEVPGGIASKRSPYVGSLFGFGSDVVPNLVLTETGMVESVVKKHIKRVDIKSFITLLNQYDSTIIESEEQQDFARKSIDDWISSHFP